MKINYILLTAVILFVAGALGQIFGLKALEFGHGVFNWFAAGEFAMGVFAAGTFSIGIFSIGVFSVGIFSFGLFSVGMWTTGLFIYGLYKRQFKVPTQ